MKYLLLLLLLFTNYNLFSQESNKEPEKSEEKREQEFKEILNIQFSQIITGNSFSNFGNFAAITSDDKSIAASLNIVQNKNYVITLAASGGATKGISDFFTDSKLNSNFSIGSSIHWINPGSEIIIGRDNAITNKYDLEEEKILNEFTLDSIGGIMHKELVFSQLQNVKDSIKIIKLEKAHTLLKGRNLNEKNKKDSLLFEIVKLKVNRENLLKKIDTLLKDKNFSKKLSSTDREYYLTEDAYQKRKLATKELNDKRRISEIEKFKVSWFSFGYEIRNDKFNLFDAEQVLANQIIDTNYTSHSLKLAYSHYNYSTAKNNNLYISGGLQFNLTSNLKSLQAIEISDIREVSSDPIREATKTTSVFEGSYSEDIKSFESYFDAYFFYGKKQNVALHLFPKVLFADDEKPISSFLVGLLVPFKKQETQTSSVNLEVFYQLNDVFNNLEAKKSLLGRNTIGIRALFPIAFL